MNIDREGSVSIIKDRLFFLLGIFLFLNSLKFLIVEYFIIPPGSNSAYSWLTKFIVYFIVNSTIIFIALRFKSTFFFVALYLLQAIYLFTNLAFFISFGLPFHARQFFQQFFEGASLIRHLAVPLHAKEFIIFIDTPVFIFMSHFYQKINKLVTSALIPAGLLQKLFLIFLTCSLLFSLKSYKIDVTKSEDRIINRFGLFTSDLLDFLVNSSEEETIKKIRYGQNLMVNNKISEKLCNIICIQVESLDADVVNYKYKGRNITPFLHELSSQCIYYPYLVSFRSKGSTSDVEFSIINSGILSSETLLSTLKSYNFPNSLVKRLRGKHFYSAAFHNNVGRFFNREKVLLKMGFNDFYDMGRMNLPESGWGAADADMLDYVKEKLKTQKSPFFYYIITMSSHEPFSNVRRYYTNELYGDLENSITKNYLTSLSYVDNCLNDFILFIKNNVADTYIFIFGDHASELGIDYLFKNSYVPLFIITPDNREFTEQRKVVSGLDLAPTILYASGINFKIQTNGVNLLDSSIKKNWIKYADVSIFSNFKNTDNLEYIPKDNIGFIMPFLIPQAGGNAEGYLYTNSLEAINYSYSRGAKFMEIDVEWTSDEQLVLLHDWEETIKRLFQVQPKKYSLKEFKSFNMINKLTQLDFNDLVNWLYDRPSTFIVTDIKRDNINALAFISRQYPQIQSRLIPQIYDFDEYDKITNLGYKKIILTLYKSNYSDKEIIEFVRSHPVAAVTMPVWRAETNLPRELDALGIFVYAHTVNDTALMEELSKNGVKGFYSDMIQP